MKLLTILYPIFMFLMLNSSCGVERMNFIIRRVIINKSSFVITVKVFQRTEVNESFSLTSGQSHTVTEICTVKNSADVTCELQWDLFLTDSIRISFDNRKKLIFCNPNVMTESNCFIQDTSGIDGNKNIIFVPFRANEGILDNGWLTTTEGDTLIHTFTITNEDYENAVPIGG